MELAAGGNFQIYQQFNGNNVTGATYNSLHIERVLTHVAAYTTTSQQTSGFKTWTRCIRDVSIFQRSSDCTSFSVAIAGFYRIVVKVHGATSSANSDHIALHVNGTEVARSVAGLNTGPACCWLKLDKIWIRSIIEILWLLGYQIACHLNEIVQLGAGGNFRIYQQFNGNSVASETYNSLIVEELPCPAVDASTADIYV